VAASELGSTRERLTAAADIIVRYEQLRQRERK